MSYRCGVPKSGDQARRRLQLAALELYRQRGYDHTTTAQIAERAGLTERTYFRHFRDKREVLFDGEIELRADLERGVAAAPAMVDPLTALFHGFAASSALLRRNRAFAEPRNDVIAATPALRERALIKEASLIDTLAAALRRRGLPDEQALLAARVGMAAFTQAVLHWFDEPGTDIDDHLSRARRDVRALVRSEKPA